MMVIVASLREEMAAFLRQGGFKEAGHDGTARFHLSPAGRQVAVVLSGIGKERAVEAASRAVERFQPDLIVSAGFAGGVKPGLRSGDLVTPEVVWGVEGPPEGWTLESAQSRSVGDGAASERLAAALDASVAKPARDGCLSVPEIVMSSSTKARIGAEFPVGIVDMESFWVCETAAQNGVPNMVVRAVLDPAEQSLPPFVDIAADDGSSRWRRALVYAIRKPSNVPGLVRLAVQAKKAQGSLAAFLRVMTTSAALTPTV